MRNDKKVNYNFWFLLVLNTIIICSLALPAKAITEQLTISAQVTSTSETSTSSESTATPPTLGGAGGQFSIISQLYQPLTITDIEVLEVKADFFKLRFVTNKESLGELAYGLSYDLEKSIWNNLWQTEHTFTLDNLREDTLYYYQIIAKDNQGNRVTSQIFNFRTLKRKDNEPPANPTNFRAEIKGLKIYLFWHNPKDNDFRDVVLFKNGQKLYEGTDENFIDGNIEQGQTYFYTLFSTDLSGNISSGVILKIVFPQYDLDNYLLSKPIRQIGEEFKITVKENDKLLLENAQVDIKKQQLSLNLDYKPNVEKINKLKIHYFPNQNVKVALDASIFKKQPSQIIFSIANLEEHLFRYEKINHRYIVDYKTPPLAKGKYNIKLLITYRDGSTDAVDIGEILIDPYGYVYRKIIHQKIALFKEITLLSLQEKVEEERVWGVKISLYQQAKNKKTFELWPAYNYEQKNPQLTDENGEYGFLVPPGIYYLEAYDEKTKQKFTSQPFEVIDRVVNKNIEISLVYIYWYQNAENIILILNLILLIILLITLFYLILKKHYNKSKPEKK